jgi:hypothetical protein
LNIMNKHFVAARLLAVAVVSGVSMTAEAALSCPFADGNGGNPGACIAGQGTWETSLQARDWLGNGVGVDAYYDPFLNITWLADAGAFFPTFGAANEWAGGLNLFGGTSWRLPTLTPVNDTSTFNTASSNNGSTDVGTAKTGVGWGEDSETGYMFYVHLGNKGYFVPNDENPDSTVLQSGWGLSNTGPFSNLTNDFYWTNLVFGPLGRSAFHFDLGIQSGAQPSGASAWAVHPGDLIGPAPVPVPAAVWLFGSAVSVVVGFGRSRGLTRKPL